MSDDDESTNPNLWYGTIDDEYSRNDEHPYGTIDWGEQMNTLGTTDPSQYNNRNRNITSHQPIISQPAVTDVQDLMRPSTSQVLAPDSQDASQILAPDSHNASQVLAPDSQQQSQQISQVTHVSPSFVVERNMPSLPSSSRRATRGSRPKVTFSEQLDVRERNELLDAFGIRDDSQPPVTFVPNVQNNNNNNTGQSEAAVSRSPSISPDPVNPRFGTIESDEDQQQTLGTIVDNDQREQIDFDRLFRNLIDQEEDERRRIEIQRVDPAYDMLNVVIPFRIGLGRIHNITVIHDNGVREVIQDPDIIDDYLDFMVSQLVESGWTPGDRLTNFILPPHTLRILEQRVVNYRQQYLRRLALLQGQLIRDEEKTRNRLIIEETRERRNISNSSHDDVVRIRKSNVDRILIIQRSLSAAATSEDVQDFLDELVQDLDMYSLTRQQQTMLASSLTNNIDRSLINPGIEATVKYILNNILRVKERTVSRRDDVSIGPSVPRQNDNMMMMSQNVIQQQRSPAQQHSGSRSPSINVNGVQVAARGWMIAAGSENGRSRFWNFVRWINNQAGIDNVPGKTSTNLETGAKEKDDSIRFLSAQIERCDTTGRLHWQGYVEFHTPKSASQVRSLLMQGADAESGWIGKVEEKGRQQAINYTMKAPTALQGTLNQMGETATRSPAANDDDVDVSVSNASTSMTHSRSSSTVMQASGQFNNLMRFSIPNNNNNSAPMLTVARFGTPGNLPMGQEWSLVTQKIQAGQSFEQIAKDHTRIVAMYPSGIGKACTVFDNEAAEKDRIVENICYWGPTESGKSSRVRREVKAEKRSLYLKIDGQWWDGYERQDTLLLDDFYGGKKNEWSSLDTMLKLMDRYPNAVNVRGGTRNARWTKMYFTSNVHPVQWYPKEEDAKVAAFLRRFTRIEYVGNVDEEPRVKEIFFCHAINSMRTRGLDPVKYMEVKKDIPSS